MIHMYVGFPVLLPEIWKSLVRLKHILKSLHLRMLECFPDKIKEGLCSKGQVLCSTKEEPREPSESASLQMKQLGM